MPIFVHVLRRLPLIGVLLISLFSAVAQAGAEVDRIVAIVEEEVILEGELMKRVEAIRQGMLHSGTAMPSDSALVKQVLDRLITEKVQIAMAERGGLKVDDETLRQAILGIAERNHLTPEELRESLRNEGIEYHDFLEQIRGEITQQRLRGSQVNSQIKISDREVDDWIAHRGVSSAHPDAEFLLGHILVAVPQTATSATVDAAKARTDKILQDLRGGQDFRQVAMGSSDSSEALKGGDLGWRKLSSVPTLFADLVPKMKKGDIEGPIRSASGFHLIKLLDIRSTAIEHVTKTHVRHILIKPNELITNPDARKKLDVIRQRVIAGDDFGDLARGNSDDKGSAVKGGDLGFVSPGSLVPEFENAMNALAINQLSEPVQSQFGWHLIQVLERKESEDTDEVLRKKAQDAIFERRVVEETEIWLRKIRDEAYVEIRVPEYIPEGYVPPPALKPKKKDPPKTEAPKPEEKEGADDEDKKDKDKKSDGKSGDKPAEQEEKGWFDGWF
jgi:peptidyl-prolyl cis-trans isomerase SurA